MLRPILLGAQPCTNNQRPTLCREGTLAYYFSIQALEALAARVGFEAVECAYHTVALRNRKRPDGPPMRRVFVHAVFRKPG